MRSGVKQMMEADVQGHCFIMSVAVNKRLLWASRQRSRMRLKLYIVTTTKVKENRKVGVSCLRGVTGAGVISLHRRNSRNLRRKQWRTKLKMK